MNNSSNKIRIPLIRPTDNAQLIMVGESINKKYFGGTIQSSLMWEYPNTSIIKDGFKEKPILISERNRSALSLIIDRVRSNDTDSALKVLIPIAEGGYSEAQKLLIQIYQKLGLDKEAKQWSIKRNQAVNKSIRPSCASIERLSDHSWGLIKVDPTLIDRAPIKVLKYVIYHEMLHEFFNTEENDPHPNYLRKMDGIFPHRFSCVQWLKDQGFSALDDE